MYTSRVKTYTVDLERGEADRWTSVISQEKTVARRLARKALKDLTGLPGFIRSAFETAYRWTGGRYVDENKAWADAIGLKTSDLLLIQCGYELSHVLWTVPWPLTIFGCTAGVRWVRGPGMVHVRSMDWALANIGDATRIVRFCSGQREFVSVHTVGAVGILSGMVPGVYSVTINWPPPIETSEVQLRPELPASRSPRVVRHVRSRRQSPQGYATVNERVFYSLRREEGPSVRN